jgi:hypothetical protein
VRRRSRPRGSRLDHAAGRRKAERHHLHRQREAPEHRHRLRIVGDDDHPARRRRHDLLAQQRAAAALDDGKAGADLVGAVDGEIELRGLVERRERHAEPLGVGAGRLRGRHPDDGEPGAHPRAEKLDEMARRRAGAEPEPHARRDIVERANRRGALELVR